MCVQNVGAAGTHLLCSSTFFFNVYVFERTSAVQCVRIAVRRTYCTAAVGIVRARATGTVGYSRYVNTAIIGTSVGVVRT